MASKHSSDAQAHELECTSSSNDGLQAVALSQRSREKAGLISRIHCALRTVQRYVWDDPDKPKEEKWFLFKLDVFLLTAACLGYFSKNLDQQNVSNAYVSGVSK